MIEVNWKLLVLPRLIFLNRTFQKLTISIMIYIRCHAASSFLLLDQFSCFDNYIVVFMMLAHNFVVYTLRFLLSFFTIKVIHIDVIIFDWIMRSSNSFFKIIDLLMHLLFRITAGQSFNVSPSIVVVFILFSIRKILWRKVIIHMVLMY